MATQGGKRSDPCVAICYMRFSFLFSSFVLYFYCVYFAYLLFDMYGDFIAITTWEADNGQFDDKFTGRKYFISNADFIMRKPTYEQMTKC